MQPQTLKFVQSKFLEYYQNSFREDALPVSLEKREFGALLFKEKTMVRHRSFLQFGQLREFLCELVPSDVYYSSAYYDNPAADEMGKKGWAGADLVFDIDADHIQTPCGKEHDTWICGNCDFVGKGVTPKECPSCGSQKIETKTWICEVCLETTKRETEKLLDMLMNDFGFSTDEMRVYFSGHRGYHVHIQAETVRCFDQAARKEIVDYIVGTGLDFDSHGFRSAGGVISGPALESSGWSGRIARGVYDLLNSSPQELENLGLSKKVVKMLDEHKNKVLESWKTTGPWNTVKGVGEASWKKIVQRGVELQSAKIDTVVTTDVHRLIRLANTLHGKTALKKTIVPHGKLEEFDPLKSAVAFERDMAKVFVHESPRFRIGDEFYGPFKERKEELPTAAALFLLCKGVAEVVV
ncbi:MAG: DNA primase small subunit domain-containing protein [Candidatus Bathyarchaeia archaeon]|jgi:DNA primase small subunit|nr:DNA primase small subunit PriS [Candidatus Bathyarchaeota archaeon A05DMB-4]MDH7595126.1 DNA primase small subunit PriS [Candidatus Bathyarchaeota archaeon]